MKPKCVVLHEKKVKGFQKKYFLYIDLIEMFSTKNLKNILLRIAKCEKNSHEEKRENKKMICCYMEIRKIRLGEVSKISSVLQAIIGNSLRTYLNIA